MAACPSPRLGQSREVAGFRSITKIRVLYLLDYSGEVTLTPGTGEIYIPRARPTSRLYLALGSLGL